MNNYIKKIVAVAITGTPTIAFAVNIGTMTFKDLVLYFITDFIKPVTVLILALAVVYFLWNIAEIIRSSKQGEELANLKTKAFWGVVAIFVMTSLWGLVQILVNTFVPGAGIPIMNTGGGGNTGGFNTSRGSTGGFNNDSALEGFRNEGLIPSGGSSDSAIEGFRNAGW